MKGLQSTSIADVIIGLLLWPRTHSSCIKSSAHHSPEVALQCSLCLQFILT